MANNQVPVDVPVVLPPEDPAPVENANVAEVPVAPQDNQEAVQGNGQQAQPLEIADQVKVLQKDLAELKAAQLKTGGVPASLQLVRQLASSPVRLRDPAMILSALQTLADEARCANDPKAAEYEAILRQTRPMMFRPDFGDVLIRLLGSKEETTVAATIAKMAKGASQPSAQPFMHPYRRPAGGRGQGFRQGRGRGVCFSCGRPGHFQRQCNANRFNNA